MLECRVSAVNSGEAMMPMPTQKVAGESAATGCCTRRRYQRSVVRPALRHECGAALCQSAWAEAETIDSGDPGHDRFLQRCLYIEQGKLQRQEIFVCELEEAKLYPRIGLVLDRRWRSMLDSIYDLARFYNFRRYTRPRQLARRKGAVSSVQHIFAENHWHWSFDCLARIWSLERYMQGEPLRLLTPDSLAVGHQEHLEMLLPDNFAVDDVAAEEWIECQRFVLPSYVTSRANASLPQEYLEFLRERVLVKLEVATPFVAQGGGTTSLARGRGIGGC